MKKPFPRPTKAAYAVEMVPAWRDFEVVRGGKVVAALELVPGTLVRLRRRSGTVAAETFTSRN